MYGCPGWYCSAVPTVKVVVVVVVVVVTVVDASAVCSAATAKRKSASSFIFIKKVSAGVLLSGRPRKTARVGRN